jgi:hypothetical protein
MYDVLLIGFETRIPRASKCKGNIISFPLVLSANPTDGTREEAFKRQKPNFKRQPTLFQKCTASRKYHRRCGGPI